MFSPFLPPTARRNPCIILIIPIYNSCYKWIEEQHHSFGLYSVTSKFSFLAWSPYYKPSLTQNRLDSLNTSISDKSDLGFPLLIGGLVLNRTCTQAFAICLTTLFLPLLTSFQSAFTPTVSSYVVACSYYIFSMILLPSTGTQQIPITIYFIEYCESTKFTHPYL